MYKFKNSRFGRRVIALGLSLAIAVTCIPFAGAITQSEINQMKKEQAALQDEMDDLAADIRSLERKEDSAVEQVKLYQKQMDLLVEQIADTEILIADYEVQIAETKVELEEAQEKAEEYYLLFCQRVRDLEEAGTVNYWSILFDAASFSDLLDRIHFVRDVVTYDNNMADALEAARQEVADTEARLNAELAAHEEALTNLEAQQDAIAAATDRTEELLEEIQANREKYAEQLEKLENENDDLAADIIDAERELKEAQAAQDAVNKNNGGSSGGGSSGGGSSKPAPPITDAGLAADICTYAKSFVGKLPYVWGGTSLVTGADCSGFVQAIYAAYGISLPRTSWAQAQAGVGVSYSEAQPGDLIFYKSSASASGGHVGIYIGGGLYVNAVGAKWGTRISSVNTSKPGLTFRRVL